MGPIAVGPTGADYSDRPGVQKLWRVAQLAKNKIESQGGFNQWELRTMFESQSLKPPNDEKFEELDVNGNGKIEKPEITNLVARYKEALAYFYQGLDVLDTNKNGQIEDSEFTEGEDFANHDRNRGTQMKTLEETIKGGLYMINY